VSQIDEGYTAELRVIATHPRAAKADAVGQVEAFLKLLAAGNDGFRIVISGVCADRAADEPATAIGFAVRATETGFFEEHVGWSKREPVWLPRTRVLRRLDELPVYLRNCIDLNYLLVTSDRQPIRWLLAATGLEALAVGRLGAQPRLTELLKAGGKRDLRTAAESALQEAGVDDFEKRNRGIERLLGTTQKPLAVHVLRYLELLAVQMFRPKTSQTGGASAGR
jgi:hypothetical protein